MLRDIPELKVTDEIPVPLKFNDVVPVPIFILL